MAKLRDTAVKDNLNVAGNILANGKVVSYEGHTHNPTNITGLDKYIEDKVKAGGITTLPENIDAKTLEGHSASDFVLKTDSINNSAKSYVYSTIIDATSLKLELSDILRMSQYSIKAETEDLIIEFDAVASTKRIIYKKPTIQMPSWKEERTNGRIYILDISNTNTKIVITLTNNQPINSSDLVISKYYDHPSDGYVLIPDIRTAMYLGYDIYFNTINKDRYINIVKPKKLLSDNNFLAISAISKTKIIDIDNDMIVFVSANNITQCTKDNIITVYSVGDGRFKRLLIKGLSDNIVIAYEYYMPLFVDEIYNKTNETYIKTDNTNIIYPQFTMEIAKKINSGRDISATINGVQFDGKTNITTPATKLITPVHINGIEFDGSQDITIPAPTNALTLGGLDSSQYIKATDVGNAAGKIPRFDNDGFLVYPDGSKERIENG